MKHLKLLFVLIAATTISASWAQNAKIKYVEATDLTLTGKIAPTPQPYHRIDTARYPTLTPSESNLVRMSCGLTVFFKTDSRNITILTDYAKVGHYANMPDITVAGYDLYIKRNGDWLYAGSLAHKNNDGTQPLKLVADMDSSMKECMLCLPLFSELRSVRIGVDSQAVIEPLESPFRHRIVYFGSSFTHGASAGRAGMNYPMQIERHTGLYIMNLGVSGNSKLQPVFADILADADADAFVIDGFSNPTADLIEARLIPFIARIRETHPRTPLIFVQTIYREGCNFNLTIRQREQDKYDMARKMMKEAMKQFDDIYFIDIPNMTGTDHETSVDGTHPSDLGLYRWASALQPKLLKIFAKYGIK